MDIDSLRRYGGSDALLDALKSFGLKELYPPQAEALKKGLLRERGSFVIASPTASGKTLIAEMAIAETFFSRMGKTIYLVPLRALAREKYEDLSRRWGQFGMKVSQSTGDFDSADPWLSKADLIITTNEKMDSLIRHHASWLRDISLVICDEIHLLGDSHRGPTLEIVITRLRLSNPRIRFIALSATIPNAGEIAGWLRAKLIESSWRPVPLREGVYSNGATIFNDGIVKWLRPDSQIDIVDLALETIKESGQALIFVNTRKAAETLAGKLSSYIPLSDEDRAYLGNLSEEVITSTTEPTKICKKLSECVRKGSAFHHAGINYSQRRLIEDSFRANRLKVLVSTTTLAMGLNLPSRRVIIRDWWRYESGLGIQPIPVIEVKQMSGRAGRPGLDSYGEAILIAKNKRDEKTLFNKYINGTPEKTDSRLGDESSLRSHILSAIAGLFARTKPELYDFLRGTFFAYQHGFSNLELLAEDILGFLSQEAMIIIQKSGLIATRFGRRVSELYIDPLSAVLIRDSLRITSTKEPPIDPFALLHMIARTPDMMHLSLRKKDYDEMLDLYSVHSDGLLINEEDKYPSEEMLSELKTASVLMQWILETHEDKITSHFGIGPGDLRTIVELADWLIYSALEVAKVIGIKLPQRALSMLRARVSYGIKEELLELVSLKGIGRVRARALFEAGYKTLHDIKRAEVFELSKIPGIGRGLAYDIKKQAEEMLKNY